MSKKVHIKTWGCQMNVYDSDRMADVVAPLGYVPSDEAASADLVIFNTCHIREKATEKLFSELGRLRFDHQAKAQRGERMLVAVAGCVAQAEGEEIKRRAPWIDMVFGPQTLSSASRNDCACPSREKGVLLNTQNFRQSREFDFSLEKIRSGISAHVSYRIQGKAAISFAPSALCLIRAGVEYSRPVAAIVTRSPKG